MSSLVSLLEVGMQEKDLLRNLLTEYLEELLAILEEEINTSYIYFDSYFTDENRSAYFILKEKQIIGFTMINAYCLLKENEIAIAEFYIQKPSRNKGFAFEAVKQIFKLSDKKWELKTSLKNQVALKFWRRVVTKNKETKRASEAHNWKGYCAPYGFNFLAQAAKNIEKYLELNDFVEVERVVETISKYLAIKSEVIKGE